MITNRRRNGPNGIDGPHSGTVFGNPPEYEGSLLGSRKPARFCLPGGLHFVDRSSAGVNNAGCQKRSRLPPVGVAKNLAASRKQRASLIHRSNIRNFPTPNMKALCLVRGSPPGFAFPGGLLFVERSRAGVNNAGCQKRSRLPPAGVAKNLAASRKRRALIHRSNIRNFPTPNIAEATNCLARSSTRK